jgi:hypothetical protein
MGQVLDVRTQVLPIGNFPTPLLPASGRTRVSGGKYVFNDLPASLQKRFRYDPLAQSVDPATGSRSAAGWRSADCSTTRTSATPP